MDKLTKGLLTVIAIGIIALNIQILNGGGFITKAHAIGDIQKAAICDEHGFECALVSSSKLYVEAR